MGNSIIGDTPKRLVYNSGTYYWGYQHFRKPPYGDVMGYVDVMDDISMICSLMSILAEGKLWLTMVGFGAK